MKFLPGRYKTKNDWTATVRKLINSQGEWFLRGAIMHGDTNMILLSYWHLNGTCAADATGQDRFDLVANDESV